MRKNGKINCTPIVVALIGAAAMIAAAYITVFRDGDPLPTPTITPSPTPTDTPTPTPSPTLTDTPTPTPSPTLTDTPIPPVLSFQDFEQNNGTVNDYFWDIWRITCSFSAPPDVHDGDRAVKCVVQPQNGEDNGGTMSINRSSGTPPIDLSGATTFSVWVFDTQGGNTIELKFKDTRDNVSNKVWSDDPAEHMKWTKITWFLAEFSGVDMTEIKEIELFEWNGGTYYFDDITYQ